MSNKKVKYLIIGAGPTGLGAAWRLKELGVDDFMLIDRNDRPGGLSSSFVDEQGFTWDIGGHVQFSHYAYFDRVMIEALGKDGWLEHQRESWVWMYDRFVPYPFQNNIRYLPKESMWKCLQGIIRAVRNPREGKPANFAEWIEATFGRGIAEEFMLPYNYKVWAYPPEDMAYQWIGERVAVTDLERVTDNILHDKDDFSWGPNNTFMFPLKGGTGAIWLAVADKIGSEHFTLGHSIEEVDGQKKAVRLSDGSTVEYEHILSTIPVDIFTTLVKDIDPKLIETAAGLKYSSSNIVGIGLKGKPKEDLATKCWMYFPEDNCPFYRVTVFSNYSPHNVPDINQHFSLMTETSESSKKEVNREKLIEETIEGLKNTKLISDKDEIVSTWMYSANYGYPTPSNERDSILNEVIPALDKMQLYSRGRFGGWKYEVSNQDHSMMQGVEWANRMELQIPEVTYFFPGVANANYAK